MGSVNQKESAEVQEIESRIHDCSIERRHGDSEIREADPIELSPVHIKLSRIGDRVKRSYRRPCVQISSAFSPNSSSDSSEGGVPDSKMFLRRGEEEMLNAPCLSYGALSLMGRQRVMEEAVSTVPGILELDGNSYDFFAVYDGHGGARVAKACQHKLHLILAHELERQKSAGNVNWTAAMAASFLKMDVEVINNREEEEEETLKTAAEMAAVVVLGKEKIVVSSCGDSRVVLYRAGFAVPLCSDYKPDEQQRIEASGGHGSRVQGVVAASRALGDQDLEPHVTSEPEVVVAERTEADEFLVIASDGLWDVVTEEIACEVVRSTFDEQVIRRRPPEVERAVEAADAAALLVGLALGRGSGGNISIIVVQLKKP